jgi:hypothetical protein
MSVYRYENPERMFLNEIDAGGYFENKYFSCVDQVAMFIDVYFVPIQVTRRLRRRRRSLRRTRL